MALFLVFSGALASVDLSPKFARIPINSSQQFEIELVGEGQVYEVKAYGSGLSWSTRNLWVGPYGKTETITFTPESAGDFMITVEMGEERGSAEVTVFQPQSYDIARQISEARQQVQTEEDREKLDAIEELYNQSRFQQAQIQLNQLVEDMQTAQEQNDGAATVLPHIILAFFLLLALVVVVRFAF